MKKAIFSLILVSGAVLVFLLILEVAFRILGYPSRIDQDRDELVRRQSQLANQLGEDDTGGPYMLLNPYFGYTNVPDSESVHGQKINNLGFASPVDFPYQRSGSDEFIIVFLGGSVAEILTVESGAYLSELLEETEELSPRRVLVLNCATGAYKQPQQLFILSYLLARGMDIDVVVNVDGFNEVAISMINRKKGTDIFYPSVFYWDEMLTYLTGGTRGMLSNPAYLELIARRYRALQSQKQALDRLLESPWRRSALGSFVLNRFYGRSELGVKNIQDNLQDLTARITPSWERKVRTGPSESDRIQDAVALWAQSSRMIDQLCRVRNIRYLHLLQPNQYDPEGKKLTREEKKSAYNPDSPFIPGARLGYPLLREAGKLLITDGVEYLDLSKIFNDRPEDIYVDDCCHFNQLGNNIIMEVVADWILSDVKDQKSSGDIDLDPLSPPSRK